jgi:uncharacterized protein YjiS (DUF1127 family)
LRSDDPAESHFEETDMSDTLFTARPPGRITTALAPGYRAHRRRPLGPILSALIDRHGARANAVAGLRAAMLRAIERARTRRTLDGLDDRLRHDIGLPERPAWPPFTRPFL